MPFLKPETDRTWRRAWRSRNPRNIKQYRANYVRRHPERAKELKAARNRRYYERHREAETARKRVWGKANREKRRAIGKRYRRTTFVKHKYGLSAQQYARLLENQDHKCAICRIRFNKNVAARRPCGDRCAKAGHVRALLCTRCHSGIAMFRHSVALTLKAAKYLERETLLGGQ
jgi:recombination endonuclease VII